MLDRRSGHYRDHELVEMQDAIKVVDDSLEPLRFYAKHDRRVWVSDHGFGGFRIVLENMDAMPFRKFFTSRLLRVAC